MSLLRAAHRTGLASRSVVSSIVNRARRETTSAAQSGVVAQRQPSEITTTVPPKEPVAADLISGAPVELRQRTVRIFRPTRSTMQSGSARGDKWRVDFDILQGGGRWENPQMGWASSADYMQGTRLSFRTREDAIHFAEKQGWNYYIQPEPVKRIPPKNYSENYLYNPNKLRICKTE